MGTPTTRNKNPARRRPSSKSQKKPMSSAPSRTTPDNPLGMNVSMPSPKSIGVDIQVPPRSKSCVKERPCSSWPTEEKATRTNARRSKSVGHSERQNLVRNRTSPVPTEVKPSRSTRSPPLKQRRASAPAGAPTPLTTNKKTPSSPKEVDYFDNPTRLSRLVQYQMYDVALQRLEEAPEEASTWVVAKRSDMSPKSEGSSSEPEKTAEMQTKKFWIRSLPLHIAARNLRLTKDESTKSLLNELIVTLIATYPAACQERDHQGSLALHECVLYGANPETISTFLMMDPNLLFAHDRQGRSLADVNAQSSSVSNAAGIVNGSPQTSARRQQKIQELLELPVAFWQQAHQQAIVQLEQADMFQQQQEKDEKSHTTSTDNAPTTITATTGEVTNSTIVAASINLSAGQKSKSSRQAPTKQASRMSSVATDDLSPSIAWEHLEERAITLERMLVEMSEKNSRLHGRLRKLVKSQQDNTAASAAKEHSSLRDCIEVSQVSGMKDDVAAMHHENRALKEQLRSLKKVLRQSKEMLKKSEAAASQKNGEQGSGAGSDLQEMTSLEAKEEEKDIKKQRKKNKKLRRQYREMNSRCKLQASRIHDLEDAVESLLHDEANLPLVLSVTDSDDISCITPVLVKERSDDDWLDDDDDLDDDWLLDDDFDDEDDEDDDDDDDEYNSIQRPPKARSKSAPRNRFKLPHEFDWLPPSVILPETDNLEILLDHASRQEEADPRLSKARMLLKLDDEAPPPHPSRQYQDQSQPHQQQSNQSLEPPKQQQQQISNERVQHILQSPPPPPREYEDLSQPHQQQSNQSQEPPKQQQPQRQQHGQQQELSKERIQHILPIPPPPPLPRRRRRRARRRQTMPASVTAATAETRSQSTTTQPAQNTSRPAVMDSSTIPPRNRRERERACV